MKREVILILLSLSLIFIIGCSGVKYSKEQIDGLASCLADKGVKEYGAFWCPNCAKQEKLFGSSMIILKSREVYVECDPRCDTEDLPIACRGIRGQSSLCLEKNVAKYPTWEFSDGSVIVGVTPLQQLADKGGCTLV